MTPPLQSAAAPYIPGKACEKLIGDLQPTTLSQADWTAGDSKKIPNEGFLLLLVILVLGGIYLAISLPYEIPKFHDKAIDQGISALGGLIVIALFVERSLQVYVNNMRALNRQRLDLVIEGWTAVCEKVKPLSQPDRYSMDDLLYCEEQLRNWTNKRAFYRVKTGKIAFLAAIGLGILIAAAGPRILVELVQTPPVGEGLRAMLFSVLDVLIIGGLIGGGAEQLHHVMEMLTSHAKKHTPPQ